RNSLEPVRESIRIIALFPSRVRAFREDQLTQCRERKIIAAEWRILLKVTVRAAFDNASIHIAVAILVVVQPDSGSVANVAVALAFPGLAVPLGYILPSPRLAFAVNLAALVDNNEVLAALPNVVKQHVHFGVGNVVA